MTYLISDERLEGIAIGLRFGLENGKVEIQEKLNDAVVEIARRHHTRIEKKVTI